MMIIAGLYPLNSKAKNHERGNINNIGMKICGLNVCNYFIRYVKIAI